MKRAAVFASFVFTKQPARIRQVRAGGLAGWRADGLAGWRALTLPCTLVCGSQWQCAGVQQGQIGERLPPPAQDVSGAASNHAAFNRAASNPNPCRCWARCM